LPGASGASFYAAFWRGGSGSLSIAGAEMQHALLKAKRRIRDLSRDDPVTGLLNERVFREVLDHDWAVAARERSALAVVLFSLDEFEAYVDVFGRHASDSCLRRVGQAIRRCLRRASDVVGRLDRERFAVLSHAPDEHAVRDFAERISTAVRELGLHHPRSRAGRFVTVSFRVGLVRAAEESRSAGEFLDELLAGFSE
jgi:diguanylate cyclase (GGDEF)-like protein